MAFDWFRRQFGEAEEKTQNPADNPTEAIESAESTENAEGEADSAGQTSEPEGAEDYLKWARAAYQNIQSRQGVSDAAPVAEEPNTQEAAVEAAVSEDTVSEDTVSEDTVSEDTVVEEAVVEEETAEEIAIADSTSPESPEGHSETATLPAELSPEPAAEPADAEASSEAPAAPEIAPEISPEPTPEPSSAESVEGEVSAAQPEDSAPEPAAVPFWMQAQQETQERLERLRQEAIVEPEPVLGTAAAPPQTAPVLDDFVLDEGFLWSAEVLAAQGRRPEEVSIEEITWLKRLRQGLDKTRRGLINQLKAIVGQGPLNQDAVMEIEAALLQADVGVEATDAIIEALQAKLRQETLPPEQAIAYLKQLIRDLLDAPLNGTRFFFPEKERLNIWLITGVNGAGKTTTIGKLAHIAQKSDYSCLIAAADTFRAAAVEQVKVWGARSGVEVIANPGQNTDPAAVVFDAIGAAQSRGIELLLVDTAGRLQNKKNLMDELSKVRRIIDKKAEGAVVESLLVLDATLGQNGLRQAQVFAESAQLSGVVLTKLDGTAKGGIALAIVKELGLPIRFIGAGEGIEDLRPFSSYEFVEALLNG
jgi:fused signal recognition particle receptor